MRARVAWLSMAVIEAAGSAIAAEAPRTGFDLMSAPLQAMQRDDGQNPAMLWVKDGRARWNQRAGQAGRACSDCHGADPGVRLLGAATRYPAWDATTGRVLNLADRIALCQQRHQQAAPDPEEHDAALALAAAVAIASRGLPVAPPDDPGTAAAREEGRRWWQRRQGQLDLSCADCHDRLAGRRLGGSAIPPGNALGYPTYRLEWQTLGSLARRIRNCLAGVRAEPLPAAGPELRALEAYLAGRERGLPMQAPAVRP